jgi:hypothetical protein
MADHYEVVSGVLDMGSMSVQLDNPSRFFYGRWDDTRAGLRRGQGFFHIRLNFVITDEGWRVDFNEFGRRDSLIWRFSLLPKLPRVAL